MLIARKALIVRANSTKVGQIITERDVMGEAGENALQEARDVMRNLAAFLLKVNELNESDSATELLALSSELVKLANMRSSQPSQIEEHSLLLVH